MPGNYPYQGKDLLLQVAAGDQQAFARLFDQYRPTVYTVALRITGDPIIAEEILQDTFLKVWIRRDSLPGIDNFPAWLYVIAQNLTFTALRKIQREKKHGEQFGREAPPVFEPGPERIFTEKEYSVLLDKAVRRLPEKQRQTYKLLKQEGMKRDEAAQVLGVSPETVKWNLDQAMRSIRAFCLANMETVLVFVLLNIST